jgi:hypothetical protein
VRRILKKKTFFWRNFLISQAQITPFCNNKGKIICGICDCDDASYGPKCECSKADLSEFKSGNTTSCIE